MTKTDFASVNEKMGKYRWTICALIFFATTINYLDRNVMALLKPQLEKEFGWSEADYSYIVVAFQVAYAAGNLLVGRFIDRVGTKLGYALSLILWSIAAMSHAIARGTIGFLVARAALGVSEAGNFPAAIKATAEWFPKKERALATGIFNSGANVGSILAPLTVPFIAFKWGWQWAFILTGAIGFIWLIFWFIFYEVPQKQKRLSLRELEYIQSDADEKEEERRYAEAGTSNQRDSWGNLLRHRQTWAIVWGKFITDPVWWFFLFWLPAFLFSEYGLEGTDLALPIALVYTFSSVGSIFGGWLPLFFIKKGWTVARARRVSMLIYALLVVPVVFAQVLGQHSLWFAIGIIGLATAAHQAWSANLYTLASDVFPKKTVASVIGMGGMAGSLGGMLISFAAGALFSHFKLLGQLKTGYYIMFFICAFAYLIAWFLIQIMMPRHQKLKI